MKTFTYKGKLYPEYIKQGNAIEGILPFAKKFCQGTGLDIGGTKAWHFPDAIIVNPAVNGYDALHFPRHPKGYDYIFSSHCLEHLPSYVEALEHWRDNLKKGGQLFLYLPHPEMKYWLPQNCRKHIHKFEIETVVEVLQDLGFKDVFFTGRDLYWSFAVTGKKS